MNNLLLPLSAYLILTENCNLRCKYCFERNSRTVTQYMPEDTALKVVDTLFDNVQKLIDAGTNPNGLRVGITFFGGEPCLCPDLMQTVVEYGVNKSKETGININFSIITNGTIYNDKLEAFMERWVELTDGNINIQLSIDGTPDIQDANRPCAISTQKSSELIEANVVKFKEFFKAHNIDAMKLQLHAVISKASLPKLYESFRYFYETLKLYESKFAWVIEDDWDDDDVAILDRELGKMVNYLIPITTNIERFPLKHFDHCSGCSAGKQLVCVDTEGYIYPCHRFFFFARKNPDLTFGNINDPELDLMSSDARQKFLKFDPNSITDICQICMATNYEATGTLDGRPNDYDVKFMEVINDWFDIFQKAINEKMTVQMINYLKSKVDYLEAIIEYNGLKIPENINMNNQKHSCNGNCNGECSCKKDTAENE